MGDTMRKLSVTLLILAGLSLAACETDRDTATGGDDDLDGEAIATVDGQPIPRSLLEAFIRQYPGADLETMDEDERRELEEHLISLTILTLEAEKEGLDRDPDTRADIELQRRQALADQIIQRKEADEPITDEDLERAYEDRYAEAGTEYRARHILVDDEDKARELIGRLDDGEEFEELARDYSTDGTSADGGDLGWFEADRMVEPFANALRELDTGSYSSEPVETQFGWHIIRLDDTREGEPPEFDEVRMELERELRENYVQNLIDRLRDDYNVEH